MISVSRLEGMAASNPCLMSQACCEVKRNWALSKLKPPYKAAAEDTSSVEKCSLQARWLKMRGTGILESQSSWLGKQLYKDRQAWTNFLQFYPMFRALSFFPQLRCPEHRVELPTHTPLLLVGHAFLWLNLGKQGKLHWGRGVVIIFLSNHEVWAIGNHPKRGLIIGQLFPLYTPV